MWIKYQICYASGYGELLYQDFDDANDIQLFINDIKLENSDCYGVTRNPIWEIIDAPPLIEIQKRIKDLECKLEYINRELEKYTLLKQKYENGFTNG